MAKVWQSPEKVTAKQRVSFHLLWDWGETIPAFEVRDGQEAAFVKEMYKGDSGRTQECWGKKLLHHIPPREEGKVLYTSSQ